MKVLHVITGLAAGGAEQQLRLLLRHLPAKHRCDVVTLENPGTVAEALRRDGVSVTDLGMRGNRDLSALPRLARLIRRGQYDLVHCHLYRACVYGRVAARLAGVRTVVATEHSLLAGSIEGRALTPGVRALYLATERLGRSTVAVSAAVAGRLADWGVPEQRIRVIPNGVDPTGFTRSAQAYTADRRRIRAELGLPQDALVVGGVGRMVPGKCFDVLVDAVARLPAVLEPGRPLRLLLVGEGSERLALERQTRAVGVADRVVFTGERVDVADLFPAMDLLAAPSRTETFGLALVEALAAGLPVRWSSGPALSELPPEAAPGARRIRSAPTEYAAEIAALARTADPAGAPPQDLPQAVRHYDIARLALELSVLYEQLVPVVRPTGAPGPAAVGPPGAAGTPDPGAAGQPVPDLAAKDHRHVRQ